MLSKESNFILFNLPLCGTYGSMQSNGTNGGNNGSSNCCNCSSRSNGNGNDATNHMRIALNPTALNIFTLYARAKQKHWMALNVIPQSLTHSHAHRHYGFLWCTWFRWITKCVGCNVSRKYYSICWKKFHPVDSCK